MSRPKTRQYDSNPTNLSSCHSEMGGCCVAQRISRETFQDLSSVGPDMHYKTCSSGNGGFLKCIFPSGGSAQATRGARSLSTLIKALDTVLEVCMVKGFSLDGSIKPRTAHLLALPAGRSGDVHRQDAVARTGP